MVTDFISVGVNFSVVVIGFVVGAYFIARAFAYRRQLGEMTLNMYVAIGLGALSASFYRLYYIPFYFGRATGDIALQKTVSDLSWIMLIVLTISSWTYILHLKPVFYWTKFLPWLIITALIVLLLTAIGTLAAVQLATLLR